MKQSVRIKKKHRGFFKMLMHPSKQICSIISKKHLWKSVFASALYFIIGILLERKWHFPHFYLFSILFLLIGWLCLWAIAYFEKTITTISTSLSNQPKARKANYFLYRHCLESPLYILVPLAIVITFGIGGLSMFGAMTVDPTLIWVIVLFAVVVYVSIIGYLQYIVLAFYIWKLTRGTGKYQYLPKTMAECIPAQLEWLQSLTKLSHSYRSAFFALGSAYIVAFSSFCWLPEMFAKTTSCAFYLLWGIIFVVIVMLFPAVSILEHYWIKQIVQQIKLSYLEDMEAENKLKGSRETVIFSPATERLAKTLCAIQIINSSEYPLKSRGAACFATVMSVFNFGASAATIIQVVPALSSVFLQIV